MIVKLDAWVLGEAWRRLREWLREGLSPGWMAVNMSARVFGRADLPEQIRATLDDFGTGYSSLSYLPR